MRLMVVVLAVLACVGCARRQDPPPSAAVVPVVVQKASADVVQKRNRNRCPRRNQPILSRRQSCPRQHRPPPQFTPQPQPERQQLAHAIARMTTRRTGAFAAAGAPTTNRVVGSPLATVKPHRNDIPGCAVDCICERTHLSGFTTCLRHWQRNKFLICQDQHEPIAFTLSRRNLPWVK